MDWSVEKGDHGPFEETISAFSLKRLESLDR